MSEKYVTLAEVKELLNAESERRELDFSQTASMEHARAVSHMSSEDAKAIMAEVMQIDGISEFHAAKIADFLPQYPEDIRAIFSKERMNLTNEFYDSVIDVVLKHL